MRVRRLLMTLLWALPVLYLAIVGAAWAVQRKLIYFPDRLEGEPRLDTAYGAHLVTFPSGDGVRITGLYAPPRDATGPVVLIAHGNAGSLPSWEPMLGDYVGEGVGGLLLDLRGYGWSEGSPSEEGWALDGEAAVEWLRGQGIETRRLVLHGVSIGCGVVLPLAAKHRVRGVVLQSPFSSLASVAKEHFGFLPVGWILRDRYDNLAAAPGVSCPVLLVHGEADREVPCDHSRRLAAALDGRSTLVLAPRFGHNDLESWPGYWPALNSFLASLR